MKNINIVSGISMGLGKELYNALSKKDITFGLTSKQNNPDRNVLYIPYFEVNENIDKIFSDLLVLLKNYKPEKISIYFNSAVYDKEKDSDLDKARILNINYFNQIILYNFLKKKFKNIKFKLIFFSSFEIYNNNSNLIYYKLSKQKYVEEYERLKNDKNLIIKLFIIGGIKTSTYNKNIALKKRSMLRGFLAINLKKSTIFIIKKCEKDSTKKYFYPLKYYYLNKIRKILK